MVRIANDLPLRGKPAIGRVVVATGSCPGGTVTNLARTRFASWPSKIDWASSVAPLSERGTDSIGSFFDPADAAAAKTTAKAKAAAVASNRRRRLGVE